MHMQRIFVALGVSAGLAITAAAAPAAAGDWQPWEGQSATAPRAIFTSGTDSQGAVLRCDDTGQLSAVLSLKAEPLPELLAKDTLFAHSETARISVGDSEESKTRMLVIPARDIVQTDKHSVAAKVFNAAVRGETLKVSLKRAGKIETLLPAPDQTFKAFADTCKERREASDA